MIRLLPALALLAAPFAATAQTTPAAPPITLEQRTLLRCSAAFAMVANRQASGNAQALQYPPLAERGREFFVRASAQVMDDAGLDRDQIAQVLRAEAQSIQDNGQIDALMPVCLDVLQQSGL